jgi:hypothetical protein
LGKVFDKTKNYPITVRRFPHGSHRANMAAIVARPMVCPISERTLDSSIPQVRFSFAICTTRLSILA